MNNLLRYNIADKKFIVFDFETEGLNLFKSKPWDVAWAVYNGYNLVEKFQYYINWPNLKVSVGAAMTTGFNKEVVEKNATDAKIVIDKLDSFLYDSEYLVIGANIIHYDVFIHNVARNLVGKTTDFSYLDRIIDTNAIAKAFKLGVKPPKEKFDFIPFQYRMLNYIKKGLKTSNSIMAKEFNLQVDETKLHGALYDVELTAAVFFQLMNNVELIDYK